MNTRELRIGNYVFVERVGIVKVNGITRHKIGYCPKPNYEKYARSREVNPIELTDDIISKIAVRQEYLSHIINGQDLTGKDGVHLVSKGKWYEVKSLHQLQNLYFALSGLELEINL